MLTSSKDAFYIDVGNTTPEEARAMVAEVRRKLNNMTDTEKLKICLEALQEVPYAESPMDMIRIAQEACEKISEPCHDGTIDDDKKR